MRTREQKLLNLSTYGNYRETLIHSTDTQIALSIYESTKEDPCVVFLPGVLTHPLFYDDFLSSLAESGFNVIGVHFVSHGKSPRERELYSFADLVQNVQDAIAFCTASFNDDIIIMGSSLGGIVSVAVAGIDGRVKAVLANTIMLPALSDSITLTRFPDFLKPFYKLIPLAMRLGAWLFPTLQIPIMAYVNLEKVCISEETEYQYYNDSLLLTGYPLYFLNSVFSANLTPVVDGSIRCPVVIIASKGDALFSHSYISRVFEKIEAPRKEMVLVDEPYHLTFNDCVEQVTEPVVDKLKEIIDAQSPVAVYP